MINRIGVEGYKYGKFLLPTWVDVSVEIILLCYDL
jgi:hypothetical protein